MASHDLMLGRNQDYLLARDRHLESAHDHDDMTLDLDFEEDGLEFSRNGDDREIDEDHKNTTNIVDGFRVYQEHDFRLTENHELAIVANPDLVRDMSIVPFLDSGNTHLARSPFFQSRSLVPALDHELVIGQEFPDVHSCRRALRETAIALKFEIQTVKSDKSRFTARCADKGCPWRIHAAKLPGVPNFTIRTIHEAHTCLGIAHPGHHQASVQWVANAIENPNFRPKEILKEIHRVHGIALSYKQAWRGKERIMSTVRGSFEDDYRLLPQYCHQIRKTNPGSIANVYTNPSDDTFLRLFISFEASISGFLTSCRPLIGLDRTVLRSKHLGTMLIATGFDGEGAMFPLAFGIINEEDNEESWTWFLSELNTLLESSSNSPRLTFLSDRKNAIVDSVEVNFPTAFHGFCMHHLIGAFNREYSSSALVTLLWEAAQALTVIEFEEKILEIEGLNPEAGAWIRQVPPGLWAAACFEGTRLGQLSANVAEALASWINEASGLPVIGMMECIRRQLMSWFNECREAGAQWASVLVPSADRRLGEAIDQAQTYQVLWANEAECEVIALGEAFRVDIRTRLCACGAWQLSGLPCSHAVAALLSCRQNPHSFADNCFSVASYRKAYSQTIHPIPDKASWKDDEIEIVVINPPKSMRREGRPRKRRARREEEVGRAKRSVRCSRCNQAGHFRTTCSAPI